jgi:hypothetical protein
MVSVVGKDSRFASGKEIARVASHFPVLVTCASTGTSGLHFVSSSLASNWYKLLTQLLCQQTFFDTYDCDLSLTALFTKLT